MLSASIPRVQCTTVSLKCFPKTPCASCLCLEEALISILLAPKIHLSSGKVHLLSLGKVNYSGSSCCLTVMLLGHLAMVTSTSTKLCQAEMTTLVCYDGGIKC